jgi:elongator complex protein 3
MNELEKLTSQLAATKKLDIKRLDKLKRKFCSETKLPIPQNSEILAAYRKLVADKTLNRNERFEHFLKKRKIRTMSGVAPVAVLTKPFPCPGKCAYCPDEKSMPKSYLSNEPAVMRAIRAKFDPFKQVHGRLQALEATGHSTDKIELIIMGGTFTHFPEKYQKWFIKRCFDACNEKTRGNLETAQKTNEKAVHRIIGLTLETRPDHINKTTIKRFRQLGCTKVEMGAQTLDDKILKLNRRGHNVEAIIKATELLKNTGFKVAYHWMPNLPGSTPKKDLKMFEKLFSDANFRPDMLKIYPTVVTRGSLLYRWWKTGKFRPYSNNVLVELLLKMKLATPEYVRILRLIRDIPAESIEAGNKISNLRVYLQEKLKERGQECECIRCREARENVKDVERAELFVKKYSASGGEEYFLTFSSPNKKILYAFCRLRLNKKFIQGIPEINGAALIRELHTYGQVVPLEKNKVSAAQHFGFGKKLLSEAERLAAANGFKKMAIISGIGVREYYKKRGYKLRETYMLKNL